jgi:hypothetical protein
MNSCCWHRTDLRSALRYAWHLLRYAFRDTNFHLRRLRERIKEIEAS